MADFKQNQHVLTYTIGKDSKQIDEEYKNQNISTLQNSPQFKSNQTDNQKLTREQLDLSIQKQNNAITLVTAGTTGTNLNANNTGPTQNFKTYALLLKQQNMISDFEDKLSRTLESMRSNHASHQFPLPPIASNNSNNVNNSKIDSARSSLNCNLNTTTPILQNSQILVQTIQQPPSITISDHNNKLSMQYMELEHQHHKLMTELQNSQHQNSKLEIQLEECRREAGREKAGRLQLKQENSELQSEIDEMFRQRDTDLIGKLTTDKLIEQQQIQQQEIKSLKHAVCAQCEERKGIASNITLEKEQLNLKLKDMQTIYTSQQHAMQNKIDQASKEMQIIKATHESQMSEMACDFHSQLEVMEQSLSIQKDKNQKLYGLVISLEKEKQDLVQSLRSLLNSQNELQNKVQLNQTAKNNNMVLISDNQSDQLLKDQQKTGKIQFSPQNKVLFTNEIEKTNNNEDIINSNEIELKIKPLKISASDSMNQSQNVQLQNKAGQIKKQQKDIISRSSSVHSMKQIRPSRSINDNSSAIVNANMSFQSCKRKLASAQPLEGCKNNNTKKKSEQVSKVASNKSIQFGQHQKNNQNEKHIKQEIKNPIKTQASKNNQIEKKSSGLKLNAKTNNVNKSQANIKQISLSNKENKACSSNVQQNKKNLEITKRRNDAHSTLTSKQSNKSSGIMKHKQYQVCKSINDSPCQQSLIDDFDDNGHENNNLQASIYSHDQSMYQNLKPIFQNNSLKQVD